MREAVQEQKGPLFIAAPGLRGWMISPPELTAQLPTTWRGSGSLSRMSSTRRRRGFRTFRGRAGVGARIADALKTAKRPVVISGASCRSVAVIECAANVAGLLCDSGHPAALASSRPNAIASDSR